jgi:hypothetical protein
MSVGESEAVSGLAPGLIVLMSLRPAIPGRVALLHCSLALHQPFVMVNRIAGTVNHHLAGAGEFSTGILRNFQPELTRRGTAALRNAAMFSSRVISASMLLTLSSMESFGSRNTLSCNFRAGLTDVRWLSLSSSVSPPIRCRSPPHRVYLRRQCDILLKHDLQREVQDSRISCERISAKCFSFAAIGRGWRS